MSKPPAFQFYPRDYLADADVMAMSFEERGVYVHLLSIAWLKGGIPDDRSRLAKVLGLTKRKVDALWDGLAPCWEPGEQEGWLVNPRQERQRQELEELREKRSRAGRASAEQRGNT